MFFVRHLEFESGEYPARFMKKYTSTTRGNLARELQAKLTMLRGTIQALEQEATGVRAQGPSSANVQRLEDIRRRRQAATEAERATKERQRVLQGGGE